MEQRREIAGADVHLPGDQRHRQFFPDVSADKLLRLTDDLVLAVDGVGGLQLPGRGGCGLPLKPEQQQIQLVEDDVVGVGVHNLLLPEHILQQRRHALGRGEFPVQQGSQVNAADIKGNGHKPGGDTDVGVLHVPLPRAVEDDVPLPEQKILPVHHAVERALIHVGQLGHGVGFPGKQEALFLFLVEEGVNALHPQLMIHPGAAEGAASQLLRRLLGGHHHRGVPLKRFQEEINPFADDGGLVQIEALVGFPVRAGGQNAHAHAAADPGLRRGAVDHRLRPGQPHGGSIVPEQIPVRLGALGRNAAKAAERDLIQVSDHGNQPPDKNSSRKPAVAVSESLYRKKKGMANGFPLCSEKPSKRPKNGDSCHTPYRCSRRKTPCPERKTQVGHFDGFRERRNDVQIIPAGAGRRPAPAGVTAIQKASLYR